HVSATAGLTAFHPHPLPSAHVFLAVQNLFLFYGYVDHLHLPSFPTRRSSDLISHRLMAWSIEFRWPRSSQTKPDSMRADLVDTLTLARPYVHELDTKPARPRSRQ